MYFKVKNTIFDICIVWQYNTIIIEIIWAIHTSLYRVCCIKYTWLFVNAQFYAVLRIFHCKCIFFFLSFKQLITRYQHYFWNQPKPIQLLKTCKKMCRSVWNFYMKIINSKHTLLYNLPKIYSIQRYNGLYALTNWMNMKVVISLCASLEVFFCLLYST